MPRVSFTQHLRKFFPTLQQGERVEGATVGEVIARLEARYPGFALYVADETGRVRRHVNLFVGNQPICDREAMSDALAPDDELFILQALSGG